MNSDTAVLYWIICILAVLLDVGVILYWRHKWPREKKWGFSQKLTLPFAWIAAKHWTVPVIELVLLALLALWMGRAYLDFDPNTVPGGNAHSPSRNEYRNRSFDLWTQIDGLEHLCYTDRRETQCLCPQSRCPLSHSLALVQGRQDQRLPDGYRHDHHHRG